LIIYILRGCGSRRLVLNITKTLNNKRIIAIALIIICIIIYIIINGANVKAGDKEYNENLLTTDLIMKTDYDLSPDIYESDIITNSASRNSQSMSYLAISRDTCNADYLKGKTRCIVGYSNSDASQYGFTTLVAQAKAYENITPNQRVIAGINADFFDMYTGCPEGALVIKGKMYHGTSGFPYFCITNNGKAEIRNSKQSLDDCYYAAGGGAIATYDNGALKIGKTWRVPSISYNRAAVGIKEDGSIILYADHGINSPISNGETNEELAYRMIAAGAKKILYLDGGGSTTFSSRRLGEKLTTKNSPTDGIDRPVASTIMLVSENNNDHSFDHAVIDGSRLSLPNSAVVFNAIGVDKSGECTQLPGDLKWELADSSYGSIDSSGKFISNGKTGDVIVKLLSAGNKIGETTVKIASGESRYFNNNSSSSRFILVGYNVYFINKNGTGGEATLVKDIKTTCTTRGYKIYTYKNTNKKYTVYHSKAPGHSYFKNSKGDLVCSKCGWIQRSLEKCKIYISKDKYYYDGKAKYPYVKVTCKDKNGKYVTLKRDIEYRLTYVNNVVPGVAKVKIKPISHYTGDWVCDRGSLQKGSVSKKFNIIIKRVTKVRPYKISSKYVKLKWGKIYGVTGYKIYKRNSINAKYKLVKIIKTNISKADVKDLKAGRNYQFKIKAYKQIQTKTSYGPYSRSVKVMMRN